MKLTPRERSMPSRINPSPRALRCRDETPESNVASVRMNFIQDGTFWQFLAYCAGVGGSMLIIGSAAGVVVMGLEQISFGWYLKKITGMAFLGYLAGALVYILQCTLI